MNEPGWVVALKELTKRMPSDKERAATIKEMMSDENDRAAALVMSAQIESLFRTFTESLIIPKLNSREKGFLFSGTGPMSTFSSQIQIAYAFGYIDREIRDDIDCIRLIRNTFAHSKISISFASPEIQDACVHFSKHAITPDVPTKLADLPRIKFQSAVLGLHFLLMFGIKWAEHDFMPEPDLPIRWANSPRYAHPSLLGRPKPT